VLRTKPADFMMTLLYWFQAMPAWLALVMLCAYFVGIGVLLTWIGRRLTSRLSLPHNPTALGSAQGAIGTMTSILMGLVIVSLWADFRTARGTVSAEAVEIRSLVREASLLPPASRDPQLVHLHHYVDAVVHAEWPAMASGGFANSAGRELTKLGSTAFAAPRETIDVRARVNKIAELRALRLGQTKSGLVPVLWFALLTIPIMLLGSFALAHDANPVFHYLLVGLVGVSVSLALFVALEIDLPYRGAASVSPAPIALAIRAAQSDHDIALPPNDAGEQLPERSAGSP
jgi:hypothetical protein